MTTWKEQRAFLEDIASNPPDLDYPLPTRRAIRACLARLDAAERLVAPARMLRDGETMAHYSAEIGLYEAVTAYDALVREQDGGGA